MAITHQGRWAKTPTRISEDCPPGLEYLCDIDRILVYQQPPLLVVFSGYKVNNNYEITNSAGKRMFMAAEDTGCCTRNCCGNRRPFMIRIKDFNGNPVMKLEAPTKCLGCCFPCCCLKQVRVSLISHQVIGFVQETWSCCNSNFVVQNSSYETVLTIAGPCITCNPCADIVFEILTRDGSLPIGQIRKRWAGVGKELIPDSDKFQALFPRDLDVKVKATLLGALFLIDFMFYEQITLPSMVKEVEVVVKEEDADDDDDGSQVDDKPDKAKKGAKDKKKEKDKKKKKK